MKIIGLILMTLAMTFCSKNKDANEKLVILCKVGENAIRVNYLDSTHGIVSIDRNIKGDTLFLKISVGLGKEMKSKDVLLIDEVNFINTGTTIYQIDKIDNCVKVYSGEEAIKQLKNQKL
jgi:thymidine kinase